MTSSASVAIERELHAVMLDYGANLGRLNPNDMEVVTMRLARVALDGLTDDKAVKAAWGEFPGEYDGRKVRRALAAARDAVLGDGRAG
jgi:hypothetical protein